jgi:hypothetical protein
LTEAARILLSKDALEGERKRVTVLFANLKELDQLLAGGEQTDRTPNFILVGAL